MTKWTRGLTKLQIKWALSVDKAAGGWRWPLIFISRRNTEWVDIHICSPVRFHCMLPSHRCFTPYG